MEPRDAEDTANHEAAVRETAGDATEGVPEPAASVQHGSCSMYT